MSEAIMSEADIRKRTDAIFQYIRLRFPALEQIHTNNWFGYTYRIGYNQAWMNFTINVMTMVNSKWWNYSLEITSQFPSYSRSIPLFHYNNLNDLGDQLATIVSYIKLTEGHIDTREFIENKIKEILNNE